MKSIDYSTLKHFTYKTVPNLKSIFDHFSKLHLGLNAQPEFQILNELDTVNP